MLLGMHGLFILYLGTVVSINSLQVNYHSINILLVYQSTKAQYKNRMCNTRINSYRLESSKEIYLLSVAKQLIMLPILHNIPQ